MPHPPLHLAFALTIAMMAAVLQPTSALSMTPDETLQIDAMAVGMTTRCVGRYLVDLPESFVLNSESRSEVEDVKINAVPMTHAEFHQTLAETRKRLEGETIYGQQVLSLTAIHDLPDKSGLVFNRSEAREVASHRTLELLAWRDGVRLSMSIQALDMALARIRRESDTRQTDTDQKLAHLLSIYERIRGRRDDEIPAQPGLCIPNGFVLGAQRENQMVGFVYHLRDSRDVFFTASTYDSIKESNTLLQRTGPQERAMAASGHSVLRKGKRQIHGEEYEEFLAQGPSKDDVLGVDFNLHGNELRKQTQQPFFIYTFRTGRNIPRPEMNLNEKDRLNLYKPLPKAGLTPEQAMRLWDAVTPTIRHRPGAF
jgi:hypothetical protein